MIRPSTSGDGIIKPVCSFIMNKSFANNIVYNLGVNNQKKQELLPKPLPENWNVCLQGDQSCFVISARFVIELQASCILANVLIVVRLNNTPQL